MAGWKSTIRSPTSLRCRRSIRRRTRVPWPRKSDVLTPGYAGLIAASPFVVVATRGPAGLDCSPRGDRPGFVQLADERTSLLPDRRGNNRLDTLRNLLHDPAIALIFLIPGVGETVRVRGTAVISTDPALLTRTAHDGIEPAAVVVVSVSRVYFQCQRAVVRAGLWDRSAQVDRTDSADGRNPPTARSGCSTPRRRPTTTPPWTHYITATLYQGPSKP